MASDYEAITRHNERQLGLDTASRKTQINMYSDSTHFVYEILQNADDYGATEVFFKLTKDELLIEHNGEPFTEENVEAITYFGKSTSRDDLVKTGRFGVGFKSVFALTATPTVISDDEHFQIFGLYRVREHPYPAGFSRSRTRITLPFNHESEQPDYVEDWMSPKDAYSKISFRLTSLNMNTLLFTQNIREIRWEIDGQAGHYLREDRSDSTSRLTTITNEEQLNKYLVFSRIPQWRNQKYKPVEIAFAVDENDQLTAVDEFLHVLFATTQETHLQFILNGPYRTNPSRETISEDDHFNVHLMKETCALMQDVLQQFREKGLLTTQLLSVLPNPTDKLRGFYSPLHEATVEAFKAHELVPTDDNAYASAHNVLQGPAPLREVITKKELSFFTGRENTYWAKGVSPGSRADYFLRGLDIQQWGWEQLQEALDEKYGPYVYIHDAEAHAWLRERRDSWLQKLYILLAQAIRRDECSDWTLKGCRIIRVKEGGQEIHVAGSKAYFPKGRSYGDLPQVKRAILRGKTQRATKKIEESLVALGVSTIGDEKRIDLLLETFYAEDAPKVTPQQHLKHISSFIKWWKKEKDASKFEDYEIFRTAGIGDLYKPDDCYIDAPICKSGLDGLYRDKKCMLPRKWKVWAGYRKLSDEGFRDFAVDCGVDDRLTIIRQSCNRHPKRPHLQHDYYHYVGVRYTHTSINKDYTIKGLSAMLEMKNRNVNLLIWHTLSTASPDVFQASFRPNQQYETRTDKSSLFIALSKAEWIPDKRGTLRKPADVSKGTLHTTFKYDNRNGWLDEIGFGEKAKLTDAAYKGRKEMAATLHVPFKVVEFFSGLTPDEREKESKEFNALVKAKEAARKSVQRIQQKEIPYHEALVGAFMAPGNTDSPRDARGGSTKNPDRRRKKTSQDIASAINREGKPDARFSFSVRKKWKGKNDKVRVALGEWYGGCCQICGRTFPQRSGEHYFEGLYLVPYTTAEWLDRVGNVLCVCPWHSAMFQFGRKEVDEDIIAQIMRLKAEAEAGDGHLLIYLKLCGQPVEIKFVEKHLIDLQEMIKASQRSEAASKGVPK